MADDIVADAKRRVDNRVSGSTPSSDDPLVWVSGSSTVVPKRGAVGKNQQTLSAMQQSVIAAAANRDPIFDTLADNLIRANLLAESGRNVVDYVVNGLTDAVGLHQAYIATGGNKNFTDWFSGYVQSAPEPAVAATAGGRGGYSGPVTTTTTTVTDENTAEALLNTMARDLLGRGLSNKERDKYLRQFRQAEMEAPQVTTTTSGVGSRSTETVTAADKGELLREILVKNPDYQKYQIDTTIMDMLIDDIKKGQEVIYG